MVVKLYFTDGSEVVRNFTDDELNKYNLMDNMLDYLNKFTNYPIDGYEFCDKKDGNFVLDYRDYFNNYLESFIGMEIDNKVVRNFEFFEDGSYEHTLDSLEGDGYRRSLKIIHTMDHHYYSKNTFFDPENWE